MSQSPHEIAFIKLDMLKPVDHSSTRISDTKAEEDESQLTSPSLNEKDSKVAFKSFGVRKAELVIAQMVSPYHKAIFYVTVFLGMLLLVFEQQCLGVFVGYATNSYKQHSLMSTITTIGQVAMGACAPFFARAADVFGRLEIFVIAFILKTIGTVVQSQAVDIQKYAAGTVFYGVGSTGVVTMWQLCIADASTLRWRFMSLTSLCATSIITPWTVGEITSRILKTRSWRFGIALWAYVTPLACLPFALVYFHLVWKTYQTDAWKQLSREKKTAFLDGSATARRYLGELSAATSRLEKLKARIKYILLRVMKKSIIVLWDIDFIGCLLLAVTLGLFLVPFTLAGGVSLKWSQASTIVPLVVGFVSIPIFVLWETKLTKTPLLAWEVMKDRGVWGAFMIGLFAFNITTLPNSYSYPVLLVGMNASETVATRTPSLSIFTEGIAVPIIGLIVFKLRRSKAFILLGDFIMFIATGLFVHFRGSNDGLNAKYYRDGVAAAFCVSGIAQAMFYRLTTTSLQATTNHEYMAPVTAIFTTFVTVGGAMGRCISGAIWTQKMYGAIVDNMAKLGVDTTLAMSAYATPYEFIKEHPWGSDPRRAVSLAYASVQKKLSITALCFCVPLLLCILVLRDHRLTDTQNLADVKEVGENVDPEKNVQLALSKKSQVIFKDDDDHILNFIRKVLRLPKKQPHSAM
uniref:Major facilitator superfamily (MFS) profile domain-containing protein n=1 Tax=Candidozyma auris TaxID=498019 RepID=A0A0L0NSF7_CANAR